MIQPEAEAEKKEEEREAEGFDILKYATSKLDAGQVLMKGSN